MNPKYPIYIISKGRWESRLTSKALEKMKITYYIIVEKQEYKKYASVIDPKKILVLPQRFLDDYNTFDDLKDTKSKGPGAARNFCWEHSIKLGADKHWVMDDNISSFYRYNHNELIKVDSGTVIRVAEIFTDRYINAPIAGMNYFMFVKASTNIFPYYLNTRIYSCLLIKNDIPYRWRGRYNEDTDICLRVLNDGYCTILFNAFLIYKITTQTMNGGNTKEFYANEGTLNKSQMLKDMHPKITKIVWKFGRWHHYVDYRQFKKNRLIMKKGLVIPKRVNNYGMVLKELPKKGENK